MSQHCTERRANISGYHTNDNNNSGNKKTTPSPGFGICYNPGQGSQSGSNRTLSGLNSSGSYNFSSGSSLYGAKLGKA